MRTKGSRLQKPSLAERMSEDVWPEDKNLIVELTHELNLDAYSRECHQKASLRFYSDET